MATVAYEFAQEQRILARLLDTLGQCWPGPADISLVELGFRDRDEDRRVFVELVEHLSDAGIASYDRLDVQAASGPRVRGAFLTAKGRSVLRP